MRDRFLAKRLGRRGPVGRLSGFCGVADFPTPTTRVHGYDGSGPHNSGDRDAELLRVCHAMRDRGPLSERGRLALRCPAVPIPLRVVGVGCRMCGIC